MPVYFKVLYDWHFIVSVVTIGKEDGLPMCGCMSACLYVYMHM